eukprot:CAMPEP_0177278440 /NCGR_PEP_ID=MMETSP0367-20130122/69308_1 /TAXON_ID=447022 ORGANISM="Scrippsiella hangoei-like, Strain SHHI-4" /NCGR_SAMPLE_ID=MMETSP0367 /ASSEMBLY_ACC=CAM_ASM_000362 /LENGTH=267 /DNA_ID=CAMNT_0018735055 /DNA_START=354 /DNA_END=1158 /DNA_ORIENTATION=-
MRTPLLTSEDVKDGALNSRLEANEMGVRRLAWISARMRLASKDGSRTTGHAGRCSMHAPTLRRSAEAAATAARATRLRWLPWCRLGRREPATFRAAAQRKRGVAAQPLAGTSFDSCVGAVATSASTASDGTSKASSRSISECTTTGCNAATGTFTSTVGATTSKSCAAGEVFHGMAATRTAIRAERADFEARAPATVRAAHHVSVRDAVVERCGNLRRNRRRVLLRRRGAPRRRRRRNRGHERARPCTKVNNATAIDDAAMAMTTCM